MKKLFMSFFLCFSFGVMFFIYEPMNFYFSNVNEFQFDFITIFLQTFKLFLLTFICGSVFFLIIYFINRKISDKLHFYYGVLLLFFCVFLGFFIQGIFLIGLLPDLNGGIIQWNSLVESKFYSNLIWVIIFLYIVVMSFKYGMKKCCAFLNVFVIFCCVSFVLSFTIGIFKYNLFEHREYNDISTKNINVASKNKNFMIFLVDAVDSREFNSILNNNQDKYGNLFNDFTYYPDTLSVYSYTRDSIPFILSGVWNQNSSSFYEYSNIAYSNSIFLKELGNRDYDINLYLNDLFFDNAKNGVSNILPCYFNENVFSNRYIRYALFKYLPHSLKKYTSAEKISFHFCNDEFDVNRYNYFNPIMYRMLKNNKITMIDRNYFQFIHVEGAHLPFDTDKDFNLISDGTYYQKMEASLNLINVYVNRLKDSNVYDNSVIIVLADHGYCGNDDEILCRNNPILFIKGMNEHHNEMNVSNLPISYEDLNNAYLDLLNGKLSNELFSNVKNGRVRRILEYQYTKEQHMIEFEQYGKAWDTSTLKATGRIYDRKNHMHILVVLGNVMKYFYDIFCDYGIAIIIFTLFTKVVLFPVSLYLQKNSIKMVKILPELNDIKIKFFGDKDKIAEETTKLYKREKYNGFVSVVPLVIQILLLMGLIVIINHPMKYILHVPDYVNGELQNVSLEKHSDLDRESNLLEFAVIRDIQNNKYIDEYSKVLESKKYIKKIKKFNLSFFGIDLSKVAVKDKGFVYLVPIIAGISAFILCFFQDRMNVLQMTQSKFSRYSMTILSVGLSLYLGLFVSVGIVLYWVVSNIFAIIVQWLLNCIMSPKKYIDFDKLNKSNAILNEMIISNKSVKRTREEVRKERLDYKRFFSIDNKHLVFYSESNGFYKYYKGIIEYLLEHSNIIIHYITSDYNDNIFKLEKKYSNLKAYYIGERKLITLMMRMDADVVVMTMPDLENYHIKRSYVKKDIEYICIPHAMDSLNMTMRCCSMNHYDTVFCCSKYQKEEMVKTNEVYHLKNRKLFEWGYSLLDDMILEYSKNKKKNKKKTILIAPSWQEDNIIDLCLDDILDKIKDKGYKIIVRPHPQHVKHEREKFEMLKNYYSDNKDIEIQTDFSSNDTVFNADLMITDWSGIVFEYSFTTKRPIIFIDTPMKVMNPEYKKIDVEPVNIWIREKVGIVVGLDDIDNLGKYVDEVMNASSKYVDSINKLMKEEVYHLGDSSKVGAEYIFNAVLDKIKERNK